MSTFAQRVHEAVGSGNEALMREVIAEDATVWENTDRKTRSFSDVTRFHGALAMALQSLSFDNVRITETNSGYIEQHDKIMVRKSGESFRSPACMVVFVRDGKIVKVEEYLDAASFPPEVAEARRASEASEA